MEDQSGKKQLTMAKFISSLPCGKLEAKTQIYAVEYQKQYYVSTI